MKLSSYRSIAWGLVTLPFLLMGCSPAVEYESDYSESTDFASYQTYSWHEPNEYNEASQEYLGNDIVDERIRNDVDAELAGKGFDKKDSGPVDFHVNYSVSTRERIDIHSYNTYGGLDPYWGFGGCYRYGPCFYGSGFYGIDREQWVEYYEQGTLVIDIIDADTNRLVWRGTAEGRVPKGLTPEEQVERTEEIVGKMLRNFPPSEEVPKG